VTLKSIATPEELANLIVMLVAQREVGSTLKWYEWMVVLRREVVKNDL